MATDRLVPRRGPASVGAEKLATYWRVRGYGTGALDAWNSACYCEEQRALNILLGMPTDAELRDVWRRGFPAELEIHGEKITFKYGDNSDWDFDFESTGWKLVYSSTYRERREQRVFLLGGKDFARWPSQNQIELHTTEQEMVAEYKQYNPKAGDAWARRKALERRQAVVKHASDYARGRVYPGEYYLEDAQGEIIDGTFQSVDDTSDADAFIEAAREMLRSAFR